jgi:glutathione S-transferase
VDCGLTVRSKKGQMPFVEVNGKEVADSNFVIRDLGLQFHKDLEAHLSQTDKALARAFHALIEDKLFWVMLYERTEHMKEVFGEEVHGKGMPSWSLPMRLSKSLIAWRIGSQQKQRLFMQGTGRQTLVEAVEMGKEDLKSVSDFLGSKKFFLGDKPTALDATAFGHLGQIYFLPLETELKKWMETECGNVVKFLNRIKEAYWSDWADACGKVLLNTEWMKSRQSQ